MHHYLVALFVSVAMVTVTSTPAPGGGLAHGLPVDMQPDGPDYEEDYDDIDLEQLIRDLVDKVKDDLEEKIRSEREERSNFEREVYRNEGENELKLKQEKERREKLEEDLEQARRELTQQLTEEIDARTSLKRRVDELGDQLETNRRERQLQDQVVEQVVEQVQNTKQDLEQKVEAANAARASLVRDVNILKRKVEGVQMMNNASSQGSGGSAIAFHALVTSTELRVTGRENIKFESVKLNLGNGYNPGTGEFVVPSDGAGLYFFYVHIQTIVGEKADFYLKQNNEILCKLAGDDSSSRSDFDTTTCAASTVLTQGDRVYVERGSSADTDPLWGESYSGFTGHRVTTL